MKLTRRDFLKGGAITALVLAVGVKPTSSTEQAYEQLVEGIQRSTRWEIEHPWPAPLRFTHVAGATWNVELTEAEMAVLAAGICPIYVRPESLVAYLPLLGAKNAT